MNTVSNIVDGEQIQLNAIEVP